MFLRRSSFTALALLAAVPAALAQATPDYTPRSFAHPVYGAIDIVWTDEGVPEIDGATDLGAFFGWGYAMSVDRFFQMEVARRVMRGRTAELLGASSPGTNPSANPIEEDEQARRLRYLEMAELLETTIATQRPDVYDRLLAFSAGVNEYLVEYLGPHATWGAPSHDQFRADLARIDALFVEHPLEPSRLALWTPLDSILSIWRHSEAPGTSIAGQLKLRALYDDAIQNGTHEEALAASVGSPVIDADSMTVQSTDVNQARKDALEAYAAAHGWGTSLGATAPPFVGDPNLPHPKFSHAFAVGGTRTTGSRAVLLGMPQLRADKKLIEMSVKGATFNSRGVSFAGVPGYMVGFNEDVAWSVTGAGSSPKLALALDAPSMGTYVFDGQTHAVDESQVESIPYRLPYDSSLSIPPAWGAHQITVRWANAVHHTALSDPNGEQSVRVGVPLVTDEQGSNPDIAPNTEYGLLTFRHFDDTRDTLVAYLDMLTAGSVHDLRSALDQYTSPAVTVVAGDKDGNVGFWLGKAVLLHTPDLTVAPLGALGVVDCDGPAQLPTDVIPMDLMPWVVNPRNQIVPGTRTPLEHIVLTGNSGVVGDWYPIPVYGGTGDTGRSARLRELLSAKGPDEDWTPEELLAFHYDDVNQLNQTLVRAGRHQRALGTVFGPDAEAFLNLIEDPQFAGTGGATWDEGGGHLHAAHPLAPVLGYVGTSFRTVDANGDPSDFEQLTLLYGQIATGRVQLDRWLDEQLDSGPSVDLLTAHNDPQLDAELYEFLNQSLGNAMARAKGFQSIDYDNPNHLRYAGPANTWHGQYLSRFHDGKGNDKTSGARYTAEYMTDFLPYGSLNPAHDIDSPVLHNVNGGISNQANNFYAQWVHFRWHDAPYGGVGGTGIVDRDPYAVFNPGNSMHPTSPYFANNLAQWARDGVLFDLAATQADPTRYLRPAPLQ